MIDVLAIAMLVLIACAFLEYLEKRP